MKLGLPLRTDNSKKPVKPPIVSMADIQRGYEKAPSLARYLPWRDFDEQHKVFLLEDHSDLAVGFEITPLPCEARPAEMMEKIAQAFKEALQNAIPQEKQNPWILQIFVTRESSLSGLMQTIEAAIEPERLNEPLVQAHLATMRSHLDYVCRPEGIFVDTQVTQQVFRGGLWKVYAFLYQRETQKQKKQKNQKNSKSQKSRQARWEDIQKISRKLSDQWRACGLGVKRLTIEHFYRWMVQWFNPQKSQTQAIQFPPSEHRPLGWDFCEQLFFSAPESFSKGWLFDGLPHQVITIQGMSAEPAIGHLSAERHRGTDDKLFHLLDHLPEGSVFTMAMVVQAQSEMEVHLKSIRDSAVGRHALALKVKAQVDEAEHAIANNDPILPLVMAVYIRGQDQQQLRDREAQVATLLNNNGIKVITDDELYPIDAYLRYLPMAYDFEKDQQYHYRSQYVALSDIAKLLPFYGRSRGTPNPGMVLFNRGGEPWLYDLFQDKTKNSHFLLLGETGTGKSNTLNYLIMHTLALYKPRFFIIEAGGSFDLLADYCASLGLTVNKVKIDRAQPVSLNPFAAGLQVLDQIEALESSQRKQLMMDTESRLSQDTEKGTDDIEEEDDLTESRDILGEMVLAALIMITGGEPKEEDRIRRADRMLIMDAIILAAETVRQVGRPQMIAADIVAAFEVLAEKCDPQRDLLECQKIREMAASLRYFIKDPTISQFLNQPGDPWPLADVTVVDLGLFAREGYEAPRSIAFAGVVSSILTLAEANQYSKRPIVAIFDENHLFSKLPLLATIQTRIVKMGRKLGLWLWVATQNLTDFADEARKMLSLIETWMCLSVSPDEIDKIEQFKVITEEWRSLFLSARKEKGKYTEAVVFSPRCQGLPRVVTPKVYLAMAATDQSEKYERKSVMKKLQKSELDAMKYIAYKMMETTVEELNDE
jgi:conjugative transfer ATPase